MPTRSSARHASRKGDLSVPLVSSFPPVARKDAVICILGSMPGRASLDAAQYYAHPRNSFWPLLESVLGIPRSLPYPRRLELLKERGAALWDVLGTCAREGSLDSRIEPSSIVPNDFAAFFSMHPFIGTIFFNGAKAESVYRREVLPALSEPARSLTLVRLPSTSPAHAGMTFEEKREAWGRIGRALEENAGQGYYERRSDYRRE